jgi:hypothetical protein
MSKRVLTGLGLVVLALSALGVPAGALAHSDPGPCNTCRPVADFTPTQALSSTGQAVMLSGPITCPVGDTVRVVATVSQQSTGAAAQGVWSKPCNGVTNRIWHTSGTITDGVNLTAGCAQAVGFAIFRRAGKPFDAFQWIKTVKLTGSGHTSTSANC